MQSDFIPFYPGRKEEKPMYARKSNHSFLKVMSIVLALVLVAAASIGGTLA